MSDDDDDYYEPEEVDDFKDPGKIVEEEAAAIAAEEERLKSISKNPTRDTFFNKIYEIKNKPIVTFFKNMMMFPKEVFSLMETPDFKEYYKLLNDTDPEKELIDDMRRKQSIERYINILLTAENGIVFNIDKDVSGKYVVKKNEYIIDKRKNTFTYNNATLADANAVVSKLEGSLSTDNAIRREDKNFVQRAAQSNTPLTHKTLDMYVKKGGSLSRFRKHRRHTSRKPRRHRRTKSSRKPRSKSRRK